MTENVRKPRNAERTRTKILQKALEEFAAHGFEVASLREIAKRSGVSHGMIRYYYKSKEKLWFAAFKYLYESLISELPLTGLSEEMSDDELKENFRSWLNAFVFFGAKHPEYMRIMMLESNPPSKRFRKVLKDFTRGRVQEALQAVRLLQARNILPAHVPAESILYIINSASLQIFTVAPEAKAIMDYNPLTDEAIAAHAETVVSLLLPLDRDSAANQGNE